MNPIVTPLLSFVCLGSLLRRYTEGMEGPQSCLPCPAGKCSDSAASKECYQSCPISNLVREAAAAAAAAVVSVRVVDTVVVVVSVVSGC